MQRERKNQGIETTLTRVTGRILYASALFQQGVPKKSGLLSETIVSRHLYADLS